MKIRKVKKDKTHSGKLDTQLFPECSDTKQDRDVVKKNRKRACVISDSFEIKGYKSWK